MAIGQVRLQGLDGPSRPNSPATGMSDGRSSVGFGARMSPPMCGCFARMRLSRFVTRLSCSRRSDAPAVPDSTAMSSVLARQSGQMTDLVEVFHPACVPAGTGAPQAHVPAYRSRMVLMSSPPESLTERSSAFRTADFKDGYVGPGNVVRLRVVARPTGGPRRAEREITLLDRGAEIAAARRKRRVLRRGHDVAARHGWTRAHQLRGVRRASCG